MPASPVRLAVVDDYAVVVAGVAGMLRPYRDEITVVERVSGMGVQQPVDLVLYDTFGQSQGASLRVHDVLPHTGARLVVYSWNDDPDLVEASLAAGASAYVSKGLDGESLKDALLRVHAGETITPEIRSGSNAGPHGRWPGHDAGLSAREAEVLALLCQGMSNEQIAQRAFLSLNTVKTHLRTIFRKIGVDSRVQAVLWGIDHGFRPEHMRR